MPAYNPPPQVFSSPVSNYYQGKALRADTALREKQAAALQMEIDSAPAAAEAAARKEQRDIEKHDRLQDKADREARQFWSDETKEIMSQVAEVGGAFTLARRDGVDLSVASQKYKSDLIDIVGEEAANAYWSSKIDLNDDGTVGPEEEKLIEASSIAVGKLQEEDKKSLQQADFIDPSGRATQGSFDPESGQYSASANSPIAPQAGQDDIGDPRTNSQQGAAYQEKISTYETSSDVQEMISNALPEVLSLPKTVGISGKLAQGGAGFLAAIGQEEAAEAFAEFVAGADAETIAAMQTQLQTIRGRIIPIVTGEQGKRLSEMEREIASRAVGLIDQINGIADFTKAYPLVIGSLKQLYEESWATKYRIASQDENISYPYDLASKSELMELAAEFEASGIDEKNIRRALTRLRSIQGLSSNAN